MARVKDAAATVDEPVWELPLERKYRKQLDSEIADISNLGGPYAGSTTAALFLQEFVGETPWAHIDIAGTMQSDTDDVWRPKGATGFGARMLAGWRGASPPAPDPQAAGPRQRPLPERKTSRALVVRLSGGRTPCTP